MKVSFYRSIEQSKDGEIINFSEIMNRIRSGYFYEIVYPVRQASDKATAERLKRQLPYFTTSGIFSERKVSGLIQHSGKLAIDFDNLENPESVKQILGKDKYTEYAFISCSGRGVCVIVNIDHSKHLESFLYLESYYKSTYGLIIDKSCKDVTRARFVSYDSGLIENDYFEIVNPVTKSVSCTIDDDEEKYEWVLNVHNKKQSYVVGNRHHYLVVLAHFLNKVGVSKGYTETRMVSDFSNKEKTPKEIKLIVDYCYKNVDAFGTFTINKKINELPAEFAEGTKEIYAFAFGLLHEGEYYNETTILNLCTKYLLSKDIVSNIFKWVFEAHKDEFNLNNKPEIAKVEHYIKKRFIVRRNVITQQIVIVDKETGLEGNIHSIYRALQYDNIKFTLEKLKSLIRTDFTESFNPIEDYFNSLPEWDGEDHITKLADYVTTDNQEFWRVQFKKALIRSIACALDNIENRIIITLYGEKEETGKSAFIRHLCPPALSEYYTEAELDGTKDTELQLSENFIWNLEELSTLDRQSANRLKAIISKRKVKQRRAYAEFHETHPRRCTFWACTNNNNFLTDDQHTRWLCFSVIDVNHNYNNYITGVKEVDINLVWAQAYALYKAGEVYTLTKDERDLRDTMNKVYENSSLEKEMILKLFKPAPTGLGEFMTNSDVLLHLTEFSENKIKYNHIAIGRAMKQLGFESTIKKINGKPQRGFYVYFIANDLSVKKESPGFILGFGEPNRLGNSDEVPF